MEFIMFCCLSHSFVTVLGPDPDEMSIIVLPSDDSDEEQTSWLPNKNTTTAMLSSSATVSGMIHGDSIEITYS